MFVPPGFHFCLNMCLLTALVKDSEHPPTAPGPGLKTKLYDFVFLDCLKKCWGNSKSNQLFQTSFFPMISWPYHWLKRQFVRDQRARAGHVSPPRLARGKWNLGICRLIVPYLTCGWWRGLSGVALGSQWWNRGEAQNAMVLHVETLGWNGERCEI